LEWSSMKAVYTGMLWKVNFLFRPPPEALHVKLAHCFSGHNFID
jgi:hypothetical protein